MYSDLKGIPAPRALEIPIGFFCLVVVVSILIAGIVGLVIGSMGRPSAHASAAIVGIQAGFAFGLFCAQAGWRMLRGREKRSLGLVSSGAFVVAAFLYIVSVVAGALHGTSGFVGAGVGGILTVACVLLAYWKRDSLSGTAHCEGQAKSREHA